MKKTYLPLSFIVASGLAMHISSAVAQAETEQEKIAPFESQRQELRQAKDETTEKAQQLRTEAQELRNEAAAVKEGSEALRQQLREQAEELKTDRDALKDEAMQLREEFASSLEAVEARRAERLESFTAEQRAYYEKVMAEREARRAEKLQIQSDRQNASGSAQLEVGTERLQSRNIAAIVKGATFTVDETTNVVTLTTPSGQVHELTHLPDQVISRLLNEQTLKEGEPLPELEITSSEEGLTYSTSIVKNKKLLGLFTREIPVEIVLDDATGEITEEAPPEQSFVDGILNAISF